jgi:hypothetical protein
VGAAWVAAEAATEAAAELGGTGACLAYVALTVAALAAGNLETAQDATEQALQRLGGMPAMAATPRVHGAQAALANGDLTVARRWTDQAVATSSGCWLMAALTARAQVGSRRVSRSRPNATPSTRSRSAPARARKHIQAFRRSWSVSPRWLATLAVTAKRRGCSAQRTVAGNASARCASRHGTSATRPRWRQP